MNTPAATQAAPKGQGHSEARHRTPGVGSRARTPKNESPALAPEPGAWLHALLALLLRLAGLFANDTTPEGRQAARALRDLQDLLARELPASHSHSHLRPTPRYRHAHHRPRYARIPRIHRRIILTPGIFAALFFTPRAALAARARFAASAGRVGATLSIFANPPFSFLSRQVASPTHALFVPFS